MLTKRTVQVLIDFTRVVSLGMKPPTNALLGDWSMPRSGLSTDEIKDLTDRVLGGETISHKLAEATWQASRLAARVADRQVHLPHTEGGLCGRGEALRVRLRNLMDAARMLQATLPETETTMVEEEVVATLRSDFRI